MISRPRPEVRNHLLLRFPGAEVVPLAGDASARSFFRVRTLSGATHVVMDYGRSFRDETDDQKMSRVFQTAGLPVADIEASVPDLGILILEDLGGHTLDLELEEIGWAAPVPPQPLYEAVELAAEIASSGTPVLAESERALGPALDAQRFRFEMDFFLEHFLGGLVGLPLPHDLTGELHDLADLAVETPHRVLCHRDFHSRNLVVRDDRTLAMVDIQDARWGPDGYDLASLLRDAYLEIPEIWLDPLIDLFLARTADAPGRESFRRRFEIVSCQRMIKALGTFGYQIVVLGRDRYRDAVPRTVKRLRNLLPRLEGVRGLAGDLDGLLAEGAVRAG